MASKCDICQTNCIFKRRPNAKEGELFGANCDGCKLFICKDCANLSLTETDAILLQNRVMIFLCNACKVALPDVDCLSKKYVQLQAELSRKDNYIDTLENDFEDLKSTLKQEIGRLSHENKLKDDHIKRLERRTSTLDDEILQAEETLEKIIKNQKHEITKLSSEILNLSKLNSDLSEKIIVHLKEINSLKDELVKLEYNNNQLHDEVSSLTTDNNKFIQELIATNSTKRKEKVVSADVCVQANMSYKSIKKESPKIIPKSIMNCNKKTNKRVLLVCEQMGRGLDVKLRQELQASLKTSYNVQCIIKPFALFEDVVGNISVQTRDFGVDDYVIVFAGYNDFHINRSPNTTFILNKLKDCIHTNVIVLSVPICFKNSNMCYNFNSVLSQLVFNFEKFSPNKVNFIESCNVVGKKLTNLELAGQIANAIRFSNCKNLTYIRPTVINSTECVNQTNLSRTISTPVLSLVSTGDSSLIDIHSPRASDSNFQQMLNDNIDT